ncbi:MAG: YerC/YecD family TrpR-related protein [Faecousia sp.]
MEEQKRVEQFYQAILKLKTPQECELFFKDICTVKEVQAMGQRLEVARLLDEGFNYNEVEASTGASSATISRVNKCLLGGGGYALTLGRMKEENQ